MASYNRPPSPGGRRIVQPGRTSAGSFFPPTYHDGSSRVSRDNPPPARASAERADAPRGLALRQRSPPRRTRDDDYTIRPRRLSLDPGEVGSRRPLSTIIPRSPNRNNRPVIIRDGDRPSSPLSKASKPSGGVHLEAEYTIPGSSTSGRHHHRHSSLTTGEQLRALDRNIRERVYPSSSSRMAAPPAPVVREKGDKDNRDYTYEYTGPRKEFERDLAPLPKPRERRESYSTSRERPTSMIVPGRTEAEYRRGPDAIGRSGSLRQGHRARNEDLTRRDPHATSYTRDARDNTRYRELNRPVRRGPDEEYVPHPEENPRHNRPRKPTLDDDRSDPRPRPHNLDDKRYEPRPRDHDHHRDREGEDRSKRLRDRDTYKDDDRRRDYDGHDDRSHRIRDESRDKRNKDYEEHGKGAISGTGVAAVGAATAGLVAEGARRHRQKESRDDNSHAPKDSQVYLREPGRDRLEGSETTSLSGDTRLSEDVDEDREERRRRRRRDREREDREYREAKEYDRRLREDEAESGAPGSRELQPSQTEPPLREQKSYERRPSGSMEHRPHRHGHHRRHHHHTDEHSSYSEPSSSSSGSIGGEGDDVPRQPRVVSPSNEDKPALPPPPKGILKKARERFPEEPNPVREGVAPLDAAKRGIPPEARWTRINRRLVNPEALDQEGVRYEEGPDYVIVLKVLNQDEITHYAQKTHEIREKRRQMLGAPPPPPGQGDEISDHSGGNN